MIPSYLLSPFFSDVFNHLWQSTVVIAIAGMLALLLRSNRAQTRYWLWLIASIKFLIPFSLLVSIGSWFGWTKAAAVAPASVATVVEQFGRPFAQTALHVIRSASTPASHSAFLPIILLAVWMVGFAAVLLRWCLHWLRIRAAMRAGAPLPLEMKVRALSTPALLEPGVFGIWRPVLMLPEGITEHLAPEQLQAVIAHELCHVRRRDNLAAAVHMIVEAIFWFHPLVWWLGARLVEERERACDEEVLRLGSEPSIYAEGILRTCQFYLESPLACMSGVTGSDLKQRIVRIMTHRVVRKLDAGRRFLLLAVGIAVVAGPFAYGLMSAPHGQAQSAPQPAVSGGEKLMFEAASIKPSKPGAMGGWIRNEPGGRLTVTNMSVKMLMTLAYDVQPFQVSGGPNWFESERYDLEAKPESAGATEAGKRRVDMQKGMDNDQRERLRSLLEERCKLTLHRETKEMPVYALVIAKNGPKLKGSAAAAGEPNRRMMMGMGSLTGVQVPMSFLAENLGRQLGRIVLDRTGLTGTYNFDLHWTPDQTQNGAFGGAPPPGAAPPNMPPAPDPNGPSIFTAVQDQLGLKLESQKGPVAFLVIDHVEKPSEN